MTAPIFIVLTSAALSPHSPPPRSSRIHLSEPLDAANRCSRLPTIPASVTLQLLGGDATSSPSALPLAAGAVHLHLGNAAGDGCEQLVITAPSARVALSRPCRELVMEQGRLVKAIDLAHGSSRSPLARWRLRAAYGARVAISGETAGAAVAEMPEHQCDVFFVDRGVGTRAAAVAAGSLQALSSVPIVGGALHGGGALLARVGRAQLTPTSQPSLALRLLRRLPWRAQRTAAQVSLEDRTSSLED